VNPKEWTKEELEEVDREMREFKAKRQALVDQGYSHTEAQHILDEYFKIIAESGKTPAGYTSYSIPTTEAACAVAEPSPEYVP
jgi:3-dehydroquinate dehydratase